jgi:hypothetical protein
MEIWRASTLELAMEEGAMKEELSMECGKEGAAAKEGAGRTPRGGNTVSVRGFVRAKLRGGRGNFRSPKILGVHIRNCWRWVFLHLSKKQGLGGCLGNSWRCCAPVTWQGLGDLCSYLRLRTRWKTIWSCSSSLRRGASFFCESLMCSQKALVLPFVIVMFNGVAFLYARQGRLKHSVPWRGWDMPTGLGLG